MPRFYILDRVEVALQVVVELEPLVEPLVHRVLNEHFALLRGGPRDIDDKVRVSVFKEDAFCDCPCLFGNLQLPLDLFRVGVLLSELENAVTVRIEVAFRILLFSDHENVWIGAAFVPLDGKQLPAFPVPEGELDILGEVL